MLHASDKCDLVVGSYSDRLSIFTILTLLVVESPIGENKGFNKNLFPDAYVNEYSAT